MREIDRKGYPYDYEVETKLALDQYVTKALEILFEAKSNTTLLQGQASYKNPTLDSPVPLSDSSSDYGLAKSVFYVMHTGYRSILPVIEARAVELVKKVEYFDNYTQLAIDWLDIISAIFILLVHMLLAVVVQMIQENKVRVLALYSEVRVSHVKESLLKCTDYYHFITLTTKATRAE